MGDLWSASHTCACSAQLYLLSPVAAMLQMQLAQGDSKAGTNAETRIHRTARKVLNFMYFASAASKLTLPTQESIIRCTFPAACRSAQADAL